jgi:hypothetical protein
MSDRGPTIQDEVLGLVSELVRSAKSSDVLEFASPERISESDIGGTKSSLEPRIVRRAFGHHQSRDKLDRDALLRATFSCLEAFSPFAPVWRVAGPDAPESYRKAIHQISAEVLTAPSGDAEIRGWRAITLACVALADTDSEAETAVRQVDERLRRDLGRLRDQYMPTERPALRKIEVDLQAAGLWAALLLTPSSVLLDREDVSWSEAAKEAIADHEDPDMAAIAARMAAGFHAMLLALDTWMDDATPQAFRMSLKSPPGPKPPSLDERRLRVVRSTAAAVGSHGPRADELFGFLTPSRIASSAPSERPLTRYRVTDAFPIEKGRNKFDRHAVLARLTTWFNREDQDQSDMPEQEKSQLDDRVKLLLLAAPGAVKIPLGPGSAAVHTSQPKITDPASDAVLAGAFTLHWAAKLILPRLGRGETLEHVTSWVTNLPQRVTDNKDTLQTQASEKPSIQGEQTLDEIAAMAGEAFGAAQVSRSGKDISIRLPVNGVPAVVQLKIAEIMGVATVLARCPVLLKRKVSDIGELFELQSGVMVGKIARNSDGTLVVSHSLPAVSVTTSMLSVDVIALVELAAKVSTRTSGA